jgi:hypothetical protein
MARRTARSEAASAYSTLATLAPDLPAGVVQTELLRALVTATNADRARLWRGSRGRFSAELAWPPEARVVPDVADLAELNGVELNGVELNGVELDGVALDGGPAVATARIHDGMLERGAVTITVRGARAIPAEARQWLQDTANCVLVVWRLDELRTGLEQQLRHTDRLAGELADSPRRLSTVRELERRRVATEIITLSTGRLAELRRQVDDLGLDLESGKPPDDSAAERLRNLLDELIEDFRVMVRGIHPLVLQSRGPRAALAEVAAGLSRPARISGTVPARVDQELGAALYHLTAAALQTLARSERDDPLEVHLSHAAGLLEVLVTGRARISTAALRAALTVDTDRLTAIGGGVEVRVDDDEVTLRAWVPDRLEPAAIAPRGAQAGLPSRVRAVALGLAARYGQEPGAASARALVSRLDGPIRLGVHGFSDSFPDSAQRSAWLAALGRRLPDLVLAPMDEPDVVLQPAVERPDQRVDVVLPGSGVLIRSAPWSELPDLLATEVLARADLLRSRSVLTALIELLRGAPPIELTVGRLGYDLEELQAGAFELAELEALAELRTGSLDLSRSQVRIAERLLGCSGNAPHERLGLPASTSPAELYRATAEQMQPWRRLAETATAGRRQRDACGVIVRSCEAMLTRAVADGA